MTRYHRLAAAFALIAIMTGCSTTPTTAARASTSPSAGLRAQAQPIWGRFVQCARTHGFPNWPDPVIDDSGKAEFPDVVGLNIKQAYAQVQPACATLLDQLPPQANPNSRHQPTAQELATLRRFAQCMREHDLPDWPDPNADGTFTLPQRILTGGKTLTLPAQNACKDVYDGSISVSQP